MQPEIRIVDPETRQPLAVGQRGLVLVRGPQIMQGYYQNPEMTAKAIDSQGWFNTGDLGWVTSLNDLVVTGRAKDTIVLTNGENIEPQPIEDACLRSPYCQCISFEAARANAHDCLPVNEPFTVAVAAAQ